MTGVGVLLAPKPTTTQPSLAKVTTSGTRANRRVVYGQILTGGHKVSERHEGNKMYYVFVVSEGEIGGFNAHYLDGEEVTLDAQGYVTDAKYQYGGKSMVRILTRNGIAPQTAIQELVDEVPSWTANHRLDGSAYVSMTVEAPPMDKFSEMFPNRFPAYSGLVQGKKVFDPRIGASVFSENPALQMADWLTHPDGKNLSYSRLDIDDLIEAANRCDDLIPSANGPIPRYRSLLQVMIGQDSDTTVLTNLSAACDGQVSRSLDNKVSIKVGAIFKSEYDFNNGNVIRPTNITRGPDRLDAFSTCSISFTDETMDYADNTINSLEIPSMTTRYGDKITKNLEYFACPSYAQARRLARRSIYTSNPNYIITLACRMEALQALGKTYCTVNLNYPETGITISGQGRIQSLEAVDDLSHMIVTVALIDPLVDAWTLADEGSPAAAPPNQTGSNLSAPPISALGIHNGVAIAWGDLGGYIVAMEVNKAGTWERTLSTSGDHRGFLTGLSNGSNYDVRAAIQTSYGALGPWATLSSIQAGAVSSTIAPPVVNSVTRISAGVASLSLTTSTTTRHWRTVIYNGTTVAGYVYGAAGTNQTLTLSPGVGSYTYTAVSEDAAGTTSAVSNSVNVTL